jgi:hypothetical protein
MGSNPILSAIVDYADIEFVAALSCHCGFQGREAMKIASLSGSVTPKNPPSLVLAKAGFRKRSCSNKKLD